MMRITTAERVHDMYCPDVGLGCNMNEPEQVHRCRMFQAIAYGIGETLAEQRAKDREAQSAGGDS